MCCSCFEPILIQVKAALVRRRNRPLADAHQSSPAVQTLKISRSTAQQSQSDIVVVSHSPARAFRHDFAAVPVVSAELWFLSSVCESVCELSGAKERVSVCESARSVWWWCAGSLADKAIDR